MMLSMIQDKILTGWMTLSLLVFSGVAIAVEEEPLSASDVAPKVTKLSGVIEAVVSHEISASTEQVDSFKIKQIVPHGTTVRKGQNLVWFETEDVDKKVKDAEIELRLAKLTLEDDEFAYHQFTETQTLDRAAAERSRKYAQQDYDNFVQVDRERERIAAEFSLQSSRDSLENVMEELGQLEQMYKEDDLTEQSEEIVLKRAKRSVETAQYRLDNAEIASNRLISQSIPRSETQHEDTLAKAELAHKKAMRELNSARQRREVEINRKRESFKDQEEKLAELKAERKRVVLTSPVDGIVFHGELIRGRLGDKPSIFEAGSKVTPQQVIATVVNPSKLQIRVDLDEKHLAVVSSEATCKVTLTAFEDYETTGSVKSVSTVPYASTKYDCVVALRSSKKQPMILPTMTCEMEFVSAEEGAHDVDTKDKK